MFPERDPDSRVAEIVGGLLVAFMQDSLPPIKREIAARIKAEFGGEQVHFRKDSAERNALRNEMIFRDFAAGMSTRVVAKKYHISKSHAARLYQIRESGM